MRPVGMWSQGNYPLMGGTMTRHGRQKLDRQVVVFKPQPLLGRPGKGSPSDEQGPEELESRRMFRLNIRSGIMGSSGLDCEVTDEELREISIKRRNPLWRFSHL